MWRTAGSGDGGATAPQPAVPPIVPASSPPPPAPPPGYGYPAALPTSPPQPAPPVSMPRYGPPGYPAPEAPAAAPGYATGAPAQSPPPAPPPGYTPYPSYAPPAQAAAAPPSVPLPGYPPPSYPPPGYATPTAPPAAALPRAAAPQFTALFGATPAVLQPRSHMQALLVRNTSARAAANPWLMAAVGAVLSAIVGFVLVAIAEGVLGHMVLRALNSTNGAPFFNYAAQAFTSTIHSLPMPSLLSTFAVVQGVPLQASASGAGGASASGTAMANVPLTTLVILPLLALVLGGYISAASEFTGRVRYCVARGALIGPAYAIVLALLAMVGSQSVSTNFFGSGVSGSVSIGVPIGQSFLLGLIWGCIFGALGGYIQARGGQWLRALPGDLAVVRWRQLAAATVGAIAALLSLLVFGTCVLLAAVGVAAISATSLGADGLPIFTILRDANLFGVFQTASQAGQPAMASVGGPLAFVLTLAPMLAIWLVSLAGGASLSATETDFSSTGAHSTTISLGYLNGQHPSAAVYLLALIPLVAYFIGGRVAARVAGPAQSRALNGALMAVPLSILLALLTTLTGIGGQATAGNVSASAGIAPSFGGVFLWTLIAGAIVGALGGLSAGGDALSQVPRIVTLPLRPLLYPLLDRASGTPRHARTAARGWVYDALIVGVVLSILLIVLDLLAKVLSPIITPTGYTIALEVGVLLLAIVPASYALGALFAAIPAAPTLAAPVPSPMPMPMAAVAPAVTAPPVSTGAPVLPPGGLYRHDG